MAVSSYLSGIVQLDFAPVGYQFCQHVYNMVTGTVFSSDYRGHDDNNEKNMSDSDESEDFNPSEWKSQDHYSVLGLSKLRYKASPKEIRKAYQQKVLAHHPDKQENKEDSAFKCIQIAYEILGNPKRRVAYDSVDPTFNDTVPSVCAHSKENFYEVFESVFEENSRWSTVQPVPLLGTPDATLSEVEKFYKFWYEFSSWREFSFLDEEDTENAENRDERRWMEKQNKAARLRRKKEEMSRIRTLVDNAYACDPRIKFYKEKEKEEKEIKRKAKQEAARTEALKREMEAKKKEEEERKKRQMKEEEERKLTAQQKQEKELQKKAIRKERKEIRAICKEKDYFGSSGEERIKLMEIVDYFCETLTILNLQNLNEKLSNSTNEEAKEHIEHKMAELKKKEEEERKSAASASKTKEYQSTAINKWTKEEVHLLVKAVTMYPAGTAKRWVVIAEFVNTHSTEQSVEKTHSDIIEKVKALRKLDSGDKGTQAFSEFEQKHVSKASVTSAPTVRDVSDVPHSWTAQEQKMLEEALRKYPPSSPQRWDNIAAMVSSRTKEECIARFKELVAKVKSKKQ